MRCGLVSSQCLVSSHIICNAVVCCGCLTPPRLMSCCRSSDQVIRCGVVVSHATWCNMTVSSHAMCGGALSHLLWSHLVSSRLVSSRLISSHLISSPLVSSRLVSSYLISSHLISSHLISSHLISFPAMCNAARRSSVSSPFRPVLAHCT